MRSTESPRLADLGDPTMLTRIAERLSWEFGVLGPYFL